MTGDELIREAYALTTVLGEGESPVGEQIVRAQQKLNAMLADWANMDLTRFQFDDLSLELNLPDGWDLAISSNLAILLAPAYSREVPASVARTAMNSLRRLRRKEVAPIHLSLDLERSLGGYGYGYDITTDSYP